MAPIGNYHKTENELAVRLEVTALKASELDALREGKRLEVWAHGHGLELEVVELVAEGHGALHCRIVTREVANERAKRGPRRG